MTDDKERFSDLMPDVKPLQNDTVPSEYNNPLPDDLRQVRQHSATSSDHTSPTDFLSDTVKEWLDPHDVISWKRDGVQDGVFRQLKRGHYTPTDNLNLHQHSVVQARQAVSAFIAACYQRGVRTGLVIHGRGLHSKPQPALLKSLCAQWLPQFDNVLAIHSAAPEHGGSGATYVMIRKNNAAKLADKEQNRRR